MSPKRKSEVMEEKAAIARQRAEESVKGGTCPRCGASVLYARTVGLLSVVDSAPISEPEWAVIAAGRATYNLVGSRLEARTAPARSLAAREELPVYAEHSGCGKAVPTPYRAMQKPAPRPGDDVPPFELRAWRCGVCGRLLQPEQQAYAIEYQGMYMTQCQVECTAPELPAPAERKPRYAKVDKFARRMEPKRGEVGFDE